VIAPDHSTAHAHEYALDVVEGRQLAGKFVRQACARHFADLENGESRGIYFDHQEAEDWLQFFGSLRHSKGEWDGQPFQLERWQQFIVASVFGWRRTEEHSRRFRTAYNEVARKNGKTTLLAGVGLGGLTIDCEPGAEIYSVATKRDQARIVFEEADRMVKRSESLANLVNPFRTSLAVDSTSSKFEPLGADHNTLDGLNVHFGLVDELHAHKTPALYEVIETACGARRQPLIFAITTAGSDQTSVCWEQHEYAEKILSGVLEDDAFFAYIATIDEGDRWDDENVWVKSNPNLGVSVKVDKLREEITAAQATPRKQNAVRRLRMNEWTRADTRLLEIDRWDEGAGEFLPAEIERRNEGRPCYAGLDLSSTTDVSAFVAVWPPDDPETGVFDVACRFFIPGANVHDRVLKHRVPYDQWIDEGWVIASEGEVIDYHDICDEILRFREAHPIEEIAFDRWGSVAISNDLSEEGLMMVQFGQGYGSMSSPTKDLERLVISKMLRHGGNPVLRWMADNLEVSTDPAGNIKPKKPDHTKSNKKIDGMVALIMAQSRAMFGEQHTPQESIYSDRGALVL
tara:strand:+ start:93 stop:1808 length:1716 start_codon:yes stop_codon:yes gene_type:complete